MSSVAQSWLTLCDPTRQPTRLLYPWNSPGKNAGACCHSIPQRIFLIQESNLGLPHCGQILYHLNHQGSVSKDLCYLNVSCSVCGSWQCSLSHRCSARVMSVFQCASHHFYPFYKLFLNYFRGQWVYSWEDGWTGFIGSNESEIVDLCCVFSFSQIHISAFSTKAVECDTSTVRLWLNSVFLPKWLLNSVKFSEFSKKGSKS